MTLPRTRTLSPRASAPFVLSLTLSSLASLSLTLLACGAEPTPAGSPDAPSAQASVASTASASATSAGPDAREADATAAKAVAQRHGGEYWAVYVVMGASQDAPEVKLASEQLSKRGLTFGGTFGFGSLGCDAGSAAALRAPDTENALGVYFASEADAKAFAATLAKPALAVVKIKAMCRD